MQNRPDLPSDSESYDLPHSCQYSRQDSNSPAISGQKQQIQGGRGTESGTPGGDLASIRQPADPDLAAVVKAWPALPADVRKAILDLARVREAKVRPL